MALSKKLDLMLTQSMKLCQLSKVNTQIKKLAHQSLRVRNLICKEKAMVHNSMIAHLS